MIFGLILPVKITFLGGGWQNYFVSPLTWSWANFDGVHYLGIASFGYRQFEQAFFPLYPLLIRILGAFSGIDYVKLGILLSNLSFFLAIVILYSLIKLDYPKNAFWIIAFLLFFPTSFYFASVYTESLFLFLAIGSFYAARKRLWWLAGFCGALASATRIVGVFLLPALAVEYFLTSRSDKRSFLWLLLIPLGLILYMYWLNNNYGDPFYFFHAQASFGAGRSSSGLILLPQVVFRYLKIFITADFNYQYLISVVEFISSIGALFLLIYGIKKIRWSYWVFAALAYLTPTLTGTFLSMPRFVLTIFPLFFLLPYYLGNNKVRTIWLTISIVLLFIATMLFTRGYWIA